MQWENKVKFAGQVKLVGMERGMDWKLGSVDFEHDAVSGAWMVKLYLKVNPGKIFQQMKIGQSDTLAVKCGRLMIENKKGDGIHIKLSDNDSANAKLVVSKIEKSAVKVPTSNRAEVGFTSNAVLSSHKGSENVSPLRREDVCDLTLFHSNSEISPEHHSGGWLSKKTPPMKIREHNPPPKRRLELFSPDKERRERVIRDEDKKNERQVFSQSFTGMKEYSKRNLHGGNILSAANGLGAKYFYGNHNIPATNTFYRNTHTNNSSRSLDRSPSLKRQKLSTSVCLSNHSNRMQDSRVPDSTSTSPVSLGSTASARSLDGLIYEAEAPRRHLRTGETIGFQNLGNTCFLNSPLQCLSSLEPLCLDIQSAVAEYGAELNPNSITRKLYLLMKDVRKLDVCPERVKEILTRLRTDMNVKFAPDTQQDAHELLSELLNRVDEEVKAAIRLHPHPSTKIHPPTQGATGGQEEVQASPSGGGEDAAAAASPLPSSDSVYTPTEANFCWSYRTCMYFHECKTEVMSSQTEREMTLMLAFDSSTRSLQDCINKYFESTEVEMKCEKCGKDEKATITRKIVRRPRVFILNLLRYHSDNMESTKKADHISVPSYISVCEYCADDVKRPPHADPVFMLDRIRTSKDPFLFQSPGDKSPAASGTPTKEESSQANFLTPRKGIVKAEKSQGVHETLSVLIDFVSASLRSVDKYVEDAQEMGNDISALHEGAQTIISELTTTAKSRMQLGSSASPKTSHMHEETENSHTFGSGHELLLCEELLMRLLDLENSKLGFAHDALQQTIEGLIMTRYDHIGREKSMEHLIDDLGLCVSATQCGILPGDQEQKVTTKNLKTLEKYLPPGNSHSPLQSQTVLSNPNEESDSETKTHYDGDDDTEVSFKKAVSFRDDVHYFTDEKDNCKINIDGTKQTGGRSFAHEKSSAAVSVENIWKDEHWIEEKNNSDKKTHSSEDTSSRRTGYLYSPDKNSQLLQGKDISLYTEADLQKIDYASLAEDEMMIYAQALSRFEYEKEQAVQVENISPYADVTMDSAHSPKNVCEDTSSSMTYLRATSGKDCSLKEQDASSTDLDVEETSGNSSNSVKADKSGMITSLSTTATVGTSFVTSGSHHQSQLESFDSSLVCQEELSDEDEPDGHWHDSGSGLKGLKTSYKQTPKSLDRALETSSVSDPDDLDPGKHCVSCGRWCLRECTFCGTLDQTDFDSHPLDIHLSTLQENTLFYDNSASEEKASPPKLRKCNISPTDKSDDNPEIYFVEKAKSANPSLPVPAVKSVQEPSERSGDHLVPQAPYLGPKKEYLYSPSKTNNLVKTRDYARLKSPAVSPKKRSAKGQLPKSVSFPKRLHFTGEDRIEKIHKIPDRDESSGEDCSSAEHHSTSLEVNVDDTSFLENINNCSFIDPSALHISQHSTPKVSTRMLASASSKCKTSSKSDETSNYTCSGKVGSTPSISSAVEEHSLQQLQPQASQDPDVQLDQSDTSLYTTRAISINPGKNTQENIQPENSHGAKPKTNRHLLSSESSAEEKENRCTDLDRAIHLRNIELGKADFVYKLVGVVDHTGTSQFTGHYTAYAFNTRKQKWFHLDDSETQTVTEEEVRENNTQTGYLFFYMDRDLFNKYRDKATTASSWKT